MSVEKAFEVPSIVINDQSGILSGTADPTTPGLNAPLGSLYMRDNGGVGENWVKTGATDTEWIREENAVAVTGLGIWRYRTEITAPPASGQIRFDNVDISAATEFYLHETNDDGSDISAFMDLLMVTGSVMYIQDRTDASKYALIELGTSVDDGVYRTFQIADVVEGSGGEPSQNTEITIIMSASSAVGGGDVFKVGTPVAEELAVWTGDGTLEGEPDFTYDGTTLILNSLIVSVPQFFRSRGLDDRANSRRLLVFDNVSQWGPADDDEYSFSRVLGTGSMGAAGGSGKTGGGNFIFRGETHALFPGDFSLRSGVGIWVDWDESAGIMTFLTGVGDPKTLALTIDANQDAAFEGNISSVLDITAEGQMFAEDLTLNSPNPHLYWQENDAPADEGNWRNIAQASQFRLQTATDAAPTVGANDVYIIERTGTIVDSFDVKAAILTAPQFGGDPAIGDAILAVPARTLTGVADWTDFLIDQQGLLTLGGFVVPRISAMFIATIDLAVSTGTITEFDTLAVDGIPIGNAGTTITTRQSLNVTGGRSRHQAVMSYDPILMNVLASGNTNNWTDPGFSVMTNGWRHWLQLRGNADGTSVITGIASATSQDGDTMKFTNVTAFNIGFANEDVLSTTSNRIITGTGATYVLAPDESLEIIQDETASRWRILYGGAAAAAAEINDLSAAVVWANIPDANVPESAVTQHEAAIDHDALANFFAAEHVDWAGAGAGTIHPDNYIENVPTALSTGTVTATTYGITSDGGADDVVLVEANTSLAGLLGSDKWDEIVANTLKVTNATHTGDVTGSVALTIADKAVHIAMLDDGTDGELITWDAAGVAATVPVGTVGQVLTSGGAGVAPTFQAAGGTKRYIQVSGVSAQDIDGTQITMDLATIDVTTGTGDFTLAADVVTIVNAGTYRISAQCTATDIDTGGAARTTVELAVEVNSVPVAGSVSRNYHRETEDSTGTVEFFVTVSASDLIRVRLERLGQTTNIETVPTLCKLNIEQIS